MANISKSEGAEANSDNDATTQHEGGECSKSTGSAQTETSEEKPSSGINNSPGSEEKIEFKVIYNKKKYDVSFSLNATIGELKRYESNKRTSISSCVSSGAF